MTMTVRDLAIRKKSNEASFWKGLPIPARFELGSLLCAGEVLRIKNYVLRLAGHR
jgi:hypothetical protein